MSKFSLIVYTTWCYSRIMKRELVQTKIFEKEISNLIAKNKLSRDDFDNFKKKLVENPKQGDVIPGTGGVRKTRLKSATKGKRGGFRVCYLDLEERLILFLLFVYPKNEQENLTPAEKAELKQISESIKKATYG
jgi:hypothetical protein